MMASANGILNPPLHSDPSASLSAQSTKRKRDDVSELLTNGTASSNSESSEHTAVASKTLVRDLIDVLKEYDTTPSILDFPIPDRPSSSGPQAKRQKSDDTDSRSILKRQSQDAYKNVEEVLQDIALASSGLMETLQLPSGNVHLSTHQSTVSVKVKAFQERAHELVKREKVLQEQSASIVVNGTISSQYGTNGVASTKAFTQINAGNGDNNVVLTLYGGASGAKQLFSSLQLPVEGTGVQKDIMQITREVGLPNGITTTQIISGDGSGKAGDKKRVPTLGDLFPTPPTVPSLLPPKPSKVATTRENKVGFYQPSVSEPLTRNASYSRQSITHGNWIDYSNVSSPPQGTKRKRDRAGSVTKASAESEPVMSESEKLDALFRSAYSGFAPTRDDGAAITPAAVLSRVWWQRVGEEAFEKVVDTTTSDAIKNESDTAAVTQSFSEVQLEDFEKMIAELENSTIDPTLVSQQPAPEKSAEEKDVEEILQGISELIETLNSFQRNRLLSLNSSSRPVGLLSTPDTTTLGTTTKPSESEQATYEILKSQLTLMIASLPPYAVAKLDANRLSELSISTKIEVQLDDYSGVMEEDEAATRAKVAALTANSTAARIGPPATTSHRPSTSLYGNQYAASRTGPVATNSYYNGTQTPIRPPSSNLQRPPATAPVPTYQPQRASVPVPAPYRPNPAYGTPTASYQQQAPRPAQQPYGSSASLYMPSSNGQAYMQPPTQIYPQHTAQALPSGQMMNRYPNSPAYSHQTPNQQYRYGIGAPPAPFPRQSSPQKASYSPQAAPAQVRYPPAGPPSVPQGRPYIQAPMGSQPNVNGNGLQSPGPQYPGSTSTSTPMSNYATFMTQQEQSNLMDRQRSLLAAQQQQTQQTARNAAMGGASGGQVNGNGTSPVAAGL